MEYLEVDVTVKKNFKPNMLVDIIVDGNVIRGWIAEVLSSGNTGSGIKVKLTNGMVGRVYGVPNRNDLERKNFKFYNLLMNSAEVCLVFYRKENQMFVLNDQYIYLFSSKKIAEESIKNTALDNNQFCLRTFQNVTKMLKYIEKNEIEYQFVIIDKNRQLTKNQFGELYKKFYNC